MAEIQKKWTRVLTNSNSPFIVKRNYGFSSFNVVCETETPIQIKGSARVAELKSENIDLTEGQSYGYTDGNMEDWTITIPSGATCKCVGIR